MGLALDWRHDDVKWSNRLTLSVPTPGHPTRVQTEKAALAGQPGRRGPAHASYRGA